MTPSAAAGTPAGRFLQTPHGRIFCLHRAARGEACVVVVPPFAEEMNRSRRMWSLLAAPLAAAGVGMLIPDLHGTGESDGDFADARWNSWNEDLDLACRFAREQGVRRVALLGVRLGALLALDYLRRLASPASAGIARLILWQPVLDGRQHVNQFLRLKLAAGMRQAAAKETTASLRERIARGERLEVAGYELAPELLAAIDALQAQALAPAAVERVDWLEVSTADPAALTPVSERVIETWRAAGVNVHARAVRGEPFWALQEITIAPELLALTRDLATEALAH
ncbi:MAG TPA: hydrolase 2, exosortase A system-associated [Steroidobacteraceae bacterium]|nr:hydrolase 2, exosortase A system-associated [Steroidobacteraceae bacterium]